MIMNQRMFDHYGIDTTKNMALEKKCPRPFDTVLIDKQGSCYACECQAWLPQSIGNLNSNELVDIIKSTMLTQIQDSIADGSYRYCNNKQCMYLMDMSRVPWTESTPSKALKEIRLAIDDSCNLSCPSCRSKTIFIKGGKMLSMRFHLIDKIIKYINEHDSPLNIHIGSDGDPFASLVYRYFMRNVPKKNNLSYTFQTNGLLIKQMYHRVKHIFSNVKSMNISIDGATKNTYEKLRRGGKWSKIIENLEFIKDIKNKNNFKLNLHMVVQKDNWKEMPLMLDIASQYNVDTVYFNPIQDWNVSKNFAEIKAPEELIEFKNLLNKIKKNPITNAW